AAAAPGVPKRAGGAAARGGAKAAPGAAARSERGTLNGRDLGIALGKASTLIEALPWLTEFHGGTVVIKYGGNAMVDAELKRAFAADMVFLRYPGIKAGLVHGGGRQ